MDLSRPFLILAAVFFSITVFANFLYPNKFPHVPGDIYIDRAGFRIYIPWVSSLVITLLASLTINHFFH